MATATSIAIRRAAAFTRLESAIAALKGAAVTPFEQPKGSDVREAALVEWAADELESIQNGPPAAEGQESAPEVVDIADAPGWYKKLAAKQAEAGVSTPPLYKGEGQGKWKARVAEEAAAENELSEVESDANDEGAELSVDVDEDGNPVVVTESVDGETEEPTDQDGD